MFIVLYLQCVCVWGMSCDLLSHASFVNEINLALHNTHHSPTHATHLCLHLTEREGGEGESEDRERGVGEFEAERTKN